ncbi:MAG: GOLPH3/VPS74 family protein [Chloroflexota bacterium]
MLSLAEELLLLALRDEAGTIASGASLATKYGLHGALLAELMLRGKVRLGEKQQVEIVETTPTGDALLDEMLAAVAQRAKPRKMRDWVLNPGRGAPKDIQKRLLARLVEQGILREEEGRVLWVFPRKEYPQSDPDPERRVRERVREAVLYGQSPDERTAVLLGLIKACRLVDELFPKEERADAKRRLDELTRADVAGEAVSKAVSAVQAAVMASIIASTAAGSASTSSG